jgi:hypothetical protein
MLRWRRQLELCNDDSTEAMVHRHLTNKQANCDLTSQLVAAWKLSVRYHKKVEVLCGLSLHKY